MSNYWQPKVNTYNQGMETKSAVITIRLTESIRDLLKEMAHKEVRSLSQQCEWLILQKLKDMGIVDEDFKVISRSE